MIEAINERAVLGDNNPPETTPFELSSQEIHDLYDEAKLWLDGQPVTEQAQADALNTLRDRIKKAGKKAEENRQSEVKPFQDTFAEIQARYNELIGRTKSVTGLAVKAEEAVNAALRPYLLEMDRKQQEAARIAHEEAEEKRLLALEAMLSRDASNLQSNEDAERLVQEAKKAEADARKADNAKPLAKGDGRATGLRKVWVAAIVDEREAASWVWQERRQELMAFVHDMADKAVRAGTRTIKGIEIKQEKVL